jgi:Zn-finger nucleic acid-binding protein
MIVNRSVTKIKLNTANFVSDFIRGLSDEELQELHRLDDTQLIRVVNLLRGKGKITPANIEARKKNIAVRLGETKKPDAAGLDRKIAVDLDTGLVLHCPSCGASVKRDAEKCEYCSAHLDFSLKGKTKHCPHCYQKTPANSQFCVVCGRPAEHKAEDGKVLEDRPCPRCKADLLERSVTGFTVFGCGQCDGMFIPHKTFQMMQDANERIIESMTGKVDRAQIDVMENVSYLRCPECKNMMNRKNFARVSGVIIDVCSRHGIWFDSGEMEKIMSFIAHGGLKRAREVELEDQKERAQLERMRMNNATSDMGTGFLDFGASSFESDLHMMDIAGALFNLFKK